MYDAVQCFWIESTGQRIKRAEVICPNDHRFTVLEEKYVGDDGLWSYDEVDWPTACPECAAPLPTDSDGHPDNGFIVGSRLFRDAAGREDTINGFGPGAMWDDIDFAKESVGPDGKALAVVLPNRHIWHIDREAHNCTRKGEPHQCWVRHGEPPDLTVDKNGDTCQAGAGSIWSGDYHGHLRDGVLTAG